MKLRNRPLALLATMAMGTSLLAACSSSDKNSAENGVDANGKTSGVVSYNGCEPRHPFLPGLANEGCGNGAMHFFSGRLVGYDVDGKLYNELAESITSEDNKTWTVKLKEDLKFSDDTPINSDSFINAWNYVVREQQTQAFFFENIAGYELGKDLSGLKKVDERTFTVELSQPESDFPLRLGYVTYAPLPEAAFKDIKAYGEKPVASGPYMVKEWVHQRNVTMVPNPKYKGPREPMNGGLEYRMYTSLDSAYNDLIAGNLDVLSAIPESALPTFKSDLDGRGVTRPMAGVLSIGIDMTTPHFQGEEGKLRRAAISMSINREEVIKNIFDGTKQPAEDFTSPAIDGWKSGIPGSEVLKFNPEKAKELWAKAEAISKFEGPFKVAYNADGDNRGWVDAICNQVKNNLGVPAEGESFPDYKSLAGAIHDLSLKGAFRANWTADYPSLYNFLGPVYSSNADSNRFNFKSQEFDALLKQGLSENDPKAAAEKYAKAQEILLADLPAIPLWYRSINAGYSDKVKNVEFTADSNPVLHKVLKP
ncbi:hypothetical protein BSR28_05525 [Boudabousia liubingyangii]|uniref:peptide ABC transporter substrate-binding protein n=1 Tax=Boudabousia liubingyangii TaxID=1921764 RepID=UPI00093F934F|nr:ABC transporter substrate-binding protein [Boudabousia liubingyangii]OKL46886.1 hypothetical protein BSR28_05525 [Boudabousia liubingyangii]